VLSAVAEDKNQTDASEAAQSDSAASDEACEADARKEGAVDVEALEAKIESLKDQALRAQAEAENVRRRSAREVENAHKFALERFAADLLPVIDSLEQAAETASELKDSDERVGGLAEGVKLSLKLFLDTLERAGIVQIDPEGDPFDPALHEAVSMVENDEVEPGSIVHVLQKGYTLHGRLVRAAKVVVAKSKAEQPDEG
jgi:molecular chaperone GrpE